MTLLRAQATIPLLLVLLVQNASVSSAQAQPNPNSTSSGAVPQSSQTDARAARVTALFDKGVAASRAEDWAAAREAFAEALSLEPSHYQIAATLGRAEFMLDKHRDAAEHLSFFLREAPPDTNPDTRKKIQEMYDKALTRIGALTIKVTVPGAEILVDGQVIGRAPLTGPIFVNPGKKTIDARHEGYVPARETVDVVQGSAPEVQLSLQRSDDAPAQSGGTNTRRTALIIAGAALSAAAVGAGIGLTIVSNSRASDSQKAIEEPTCDDVCKSEYGSLQNKYDELQRQKSIIGSAAVWSFVGGGALAVGTTIYGVISRSAQPKSAEGLAVHVGRGEYGLSFTGNW